MNIISRFLDTPRRSSFVLGPRGTGKSTWLRTQFPSAVYLDLLDPKLWRELVAAPERLRVYIPRPKTSIVVVIDEIQRAPQLLTVVHSILEEPSPPVFLLTGSSARRLRRVDTDLLGGRALSRTIHPFMASELDSFDLELSLIHGMLPLVVMSQDPLSVLHSYINLYVDEEVRSEALTRSVDQFLRFLEAISFSHASLLNMSGVSRECQVSLRVVQSYVTILFDLLLAFQLPIFTRRAKRATVVHSKFYFFDTGVFRSIRPKGPLDRPSEIDGAALEGFVAQHLRAWTDYQSRDSKLYFWRTRAGSEVDFVVYGSSDFTAIEVKNSRRVESKDVRALKTFTSDYPEAIAVLLYRGDTLMRVSDVLCVPVEDFLLNLTPAKTIVSIVQEYLD